MSTLKRLRRAIEAGKRIEKINPINGYECIMKFNGEYVYWYPGLGVEDRGRFSTFEELYASAEPDAEAFTQDELNTWQVMPEATEEEKQFIQPFLDALAAGDDKAFTELWVDGLKKHMERSLFDGSIKNPRAKKALARGIAYVGKELTQQ